MNHAYSKTTDLIYPTAILHRYKDLPDDLIDITDDEAQVHMGNLTPEDMQRKKHVYPFEFEPVPTPTTNQLSQQAKMTRESAIQNFHSVVALDGAEFDADEKALGNINRAIRFGESNNLPETTEQEWRLADNSWRMTTLAEIRELKFLVEQAIDTHFQNVWTQFNAWDSGDKSQPFEVNL